MAVNKGLSESLEDYLEAIYHIVREKQAARVKDIARRLDVRAASVTGALRSLAEKGLVNYAPYEIVTFTRKGEEAALRVVSRHKVLKDFFINVLLADEAAADQAACHMEHCITEQMLEKIEQISAFIADCPVSDDKPRECPFDRRN